MPVDTASTAKSACAFMAALIDLLGEMPEPNNSRRAELFAERLSELEAEAREHEASGATMAAIRGTRVLLELAELPPLRPAVQVGTEQ